MKLVLRYRSVVCGSKGVGAAYMARRATMDDAGHWITAERRNGDGNARTPIQNVKSFPCSLSPAGKCPAGGGTWVTKVVAAAPHAAAGLRVGLLVHLWIGYSAAHISVL